jgi:hypothetical protein
MANNPTNDLMLSKLALRYTAVSPTIGDLWASYSAETNGGTVGAIPGGTAGKILTPGVIWDNDALFNHYGGPETTLADRANRFWTNWVPATGG